MKTKATRAPRKKIPVRVSRRMQGALEELVGSELVRPVADQEPAYVFKHALVQDTALSTLMRGEFKRLNLLVAQAYETLYAERSRQELAAVLSEHYAAAGKDAKTLEYATLAGDRAAQAYANEEALTYYARALGAARRGGATSAQWIHLYRERGRICKVIGQYEAALEAYDALALEAESRGDRAMKLAALMLCATLKSEPVPTFDPIAAEQLLLQARALARELGDQAAESRILWNLSLLSGHTGRADSGLAYGEQSLALAEQLNLREQLSYTLHDLSNAYWVNHQPVRAREMRTQARALFRALDNKVMLADNLGMSAQYTTLEGHFQEGLELAQEGLAISRLIQNRFGIIFNNSFIGTIYLEYGDYQATIQVAEESLAAIMPSSPVSNPVMVLGVLAWIYGQIGAFERADELAVAARPFVDVPAPVWLRARAFSNLARLELERGNPAAARAYLDIVQDGYDWRRIGGPGVFNTPIALGEWSQAVGNSAHALEIAQDALGLAGEVQERYWFPELFHLRAEAQSSLGDRAAAFESLQEARHHAEEIGSRRTLWRIAAAQSRYECERGNAAAAASYQAEARELLAFIAAHVPNEYRDSFLNLPRVREVMG